MIRIRVGEGLGGALTNQGLLPFVEVIKKSYPGVDVDTFEDDVEGIAEELTSFPASDKIIIGGYSRGADYTPTIAAKVPRQVDYIFMFQPSIWYPSGPVTSNVLKGYCVYNPFWFETFGLGFRRPYKAEGNTVTQMEVVMAQDSHGAVQYNPTYQSRVLRDIGSIVKGV